MTLDVYADFGPFVPQWHPFEHAVREAAATSPATCSSQPGSPAGLAHATAGTRGTGRLWDDHRALGAVHPVVGLVVVTAFIPFSWLPIKGEVASIQRTREQSPGGP